MKYALILVVPFIVGGCSWFQPKKYDDATVAQIQKTVSYENAAFDLLNTNLDKAATATPDKVAEAINSAKAEIKARHDSEITRLNSWLFYEKSKSGSPVVAGGQ
jgi:hypothetical protein